MLHLLGTDDLGRDVFSRLLYGARVSIGIGLITVIGAAVVGVSIGMFAGYSGGWIDGVLMRLTDAANAIPLLLVALVLIVTLGPGLTNLIICLVLLLWARYPRVIRSEVIRIKELDYVRLARISGGSDAYIIMRHIFPNIVDTVTVVVTLQLGSIIILEASLSFLGAGVPAQVPSWGLMVAEGRNYVTAAWWMSTIPGLAILFTVLVFNVLGDWLRDQLDPRN
jgi:peptide/nickel transport system permease protein